MWEVTIRGDEKGTRQSGAACKFSLRGSGERRWRGKEGSKEGQAPGRGGTNIVGTPRAVTNDSIDARTEKLEPEENRRSFTGTEEPTLRFSLLYSNFLSLA